MEMSSAAPRRLVVERKLRGRLSVELDVGGAAVLSLVLIAIAVLATALIDTGDGFAPRVGTIDALAGLAVGAFAVDRLLTFVPPWAATDDPEKRSSDITRCAGAGARCSAPFSWR